MLPKRCVLPGFSASGAPCNTNADCNDINFPSQYCEGDLDCGGLYFGGSGVNTPLPTVVPDYGTSVYNVANCNGGAQTFDLNPTTAAEVGIRSCTSGSEVNTLYPKCVGGPLAGNPCHIAGDCPGNEACAGPGIPAACCTNVGTGTCGTGACSGNLNGCLYGPPLPVPNANSSATSTCVINRIVANSASSGTCGGASQINFNLSSDLYLTGDSLASRTGIQPCPICDSGTLKCDGGPNNGLACTPGEAVVTGPAFPTSHDCPPAASTYIGALPIPYSLTSGVTTLTASDKDGTCPGLGCAQVLTFCGFCRSKNPPQPFEPGPHACNSNSDCTNPSFPACQQRTDGAFGNGEAMTITETGSPAGCLDDNLPHNGKIVSTFCIPPSYNGTVDSAADLAGPGAVAMKGAAQLTP